jgi:hypothetical protein
VHSAACCTPSRTTARTGMPSVQHAGVGRRFVHRQRVEPRRSAAMLTEKETALVMELRGERGCHAAQLIPTIRPSKTRRFPPRGGVCDFRRARPGTGSTAAGMATVVAAVRDQVTTARRRRSLIDVRVRRVGFSLACAECRREPSGGVVSLKIIAEDRRRERRPALGERTRHRRGRTAEAGCSVSIPGAGGGGSGVGCGSPLAAPGWR